MLERELEGLRGVKRLQISVPQLLLNESHQQEEKLAVSEFQQQTKKFTGTIQTISGILEEVQETLLMNGSPKGPEIAHRKIEDLLSCLRQYSL